MRRMTRLPGLAAAVALTVGAAGCGHGILDLTRSAPAGGPVTVTEHVASTALVAVAGAVSANGQLFQVLGATARPLEHLDIAQADGGTPALFASASPAPATELIPAKPVPPPGGATSYQEAVYQRKLRHWEGELAAEQQAVMTRTTLATAAWVRLLLARAAASVQPDAPAAAGLVSECGLAATVLAGMVDQAGVRFGARVVVLAVGSLDGRPPPDELNGDDVLVITPFLPSAAAAAAAQENLLAACAARAAVLGPEATQAELDQLVTDDLSLQQLTETVSGPALFANNSAVLLPASARVLAPLLTRLRQPGATAVVNGYASTPGSARHNQQLSESRAAAVAAFFEAQGISASALLAVGHGASNFIAPGSSGDNRRVVVVIEEPLQQRVEEPSPGRAGSHVSCPQLRPGTDAPGGSAAELAARPPGTSGRRHLRPPSQRGSVPTPAPPAEPTARRSVPGPGRPGGCLPARLRPPSAGPGASAAAACPARAASRHPPPPPSSRRVRPAQLGRAGRLVPIGPPSGTAMPPGHAWRLNRCAGPGTWRACRDRHQTRA